MAAPPRQVNPPNRETPDFCYSPQQMHAILALRNVRMTPYLVSVKKLFNYHLLLQEQQQSRPPKPLGVIAEEQQKPNAMTQRQQVNAKFWCLFILFLIFYKFLVYLKLKLYSICKFQRAAMRRCAITTRTRRSNYPNVKKRSLNFCSFFEF